MKRIVVSIVMAAVILGSVVGGAAAIVINGVDGLLFLDSGITSFDTDAKTCTMEGIDCFVQ